MMEAPVILAAAVAAAVVAAVVIAAAVVTASVPAAVVVAAALVATDVSPPVGSVAALPESTKLVTMIAGANGEFVSTVSERLAVGSVAVLLTAYKVDVAASSVTVAASSVTVADLTGNLLKEVMAYASSLSSTAGRVVRFGSTIGGRLTPAGCEVNAVVSLAAGGAGVARGRTTSRLSSDTSSITRLMIKPSRSVLPPGMVVPTIVHLNHRKQKKKKKYFTFRKLTFLFDSSYVFK